MRRRAGARAGHDRQMQRVLLEREDEVARLAAALDQARDGRGGLALVEGPAGIGKTRVVEAAREHAASRGTAVLAARASELDHDFPFGVVRQLLEPLLATGAARARLLRGAAAGATAVLGPGAGADVAPGTDPSWAHFHALYWLVATLAEQGPAALFVDDIHWADASSLRFLQFLLPRLADLPVVVVAAARPPEGGARPHPIDALAADPLTVVVRPAPLSDRAVAALVAGRLGDGGDARFCAACREATGGNPFLLQELLRELAVEGTAPDARHTPLVRQLAP